MIPPLDVDAGRLARTRLDGLAKPLGSLGRLEELAVRLAEITGKPVPSPARKVVVVAAADHGVVKEGVTAYPSSVTAAMIATFLQGRGAINVLARLTGAAVICVDVGVTHPIPRPAVASEVRLISQRIRPGTANLATGPAMSREDAQRVISAGVDLASDLIDQGYDLIAAGDMGIGNTTASAAVIAAITGVPAEQVVGPGAGIDQAGLDRKRRVVATALSRLPENADALTVLMEVGGLELGFLAGMMTGAASRRVPVIVDGVISGAAALLAEHLAPGTRHYLLASHLSTEPGHAHALKYLQLRPFLNLEMRLGEGTGAVLAFFLVDAACRLLTEMATLEEVLATSGGRHIPS